jgi:hypothetical protein
VCVCGLVEEGEMRDRLTRRIGGHLGSSSRRLFTEGSVARVALVPRLEEPGDAVVSRSLGRVLWVGEWDIGCVCGGVWGASCRRVCAFVCNLALTWRGHLSGGGKLQDFGMKQQSSS